MENATGARKRWRGGRLPRAQVDQRISLLLDIAFEEFSLNGFDGTNLDRLVERSGVSKATIYRRFGSKEELFTTLIDRNMEMQLDRLWSLEFDLADPVGSIQKFVDVYVEIAVIPPMGRTLLQMATAERHRLPQLSAELMANARESLQPISEFIGKLMAQNMLEQGDPCEAAFELQALITHGFRALVDDLAFVERPGRARGIAQRFLRSWAWEGGD